MRPKSGGSVPASPASPGRGSGSSRPRKRKKIGASGNWSILDRIGLVTAWGTGIFLCLVASGISVYMAVKGLQFINIEMLTTSPTPAIDQSETGGFLDPMLGTLILTVLGTAIAAPLGVAIAIWLTEYGRPTWLARLVEAGTEMIVGAPSIALAIFGLLIFQTSLMAPFSFTAEGGAVFGRSFFAAGAIMSLVALPFVVGGTREALNAIPMHVREASYALGKDKASTIRRVLIPGARPGIATGTTLGMAQIVGETAVVVVLLGASLQLAPEGAIPALDVLKGTGSTLTSYVYVNSPAGEGNAPDKAYAAAFVLLAIVVLLNLSVNLIARRGSSKWT
ncbi:MAG: PstA family ABC transporter permease [Solirubrobacterales bacterium]